MDDLKDLLHFLLDTEQFDKARQIVKDSLVEISKSTSENKIFQQIELYGFLVDIGCDTGTENDISTAIKFFEDNENELEAIITKSSYYYNLANAKHGLSKIFYSNNKGVHPISICKEKFQEPISLYWMAYKQCVNEEPLLNQILINLSNSLVTVSRIIEALQMLDIVLRNNPISPQALISRGDNLNYLGSVTNCSLSVSLFTQIYSSYQRSLQTNSLPPAILERSKNGMIEAISRIESYGFSVSDLDKEIAETKKEYGNHTTFRKFCIDNFLTLNEHSIYCNCVVTTKDELQIGIPNMIFKGELLPKLELLLNRIKSEFAFARWNYYKSNTEDAFDYDITFSELLEGEIINSQTETLRTSYRICYGILDKIALGICKLYNVEGGNIFFERFWNDKQRKEVLERQRNIHLNALFSIACDLNTSTGELKHFKNWRNKLEHNLLILKNTRIKTPDFLKVYDDENFAVIVDIYDFKEKAIQLLQLTRAAIFSFVYCVRLETITTKELDEDVFTFKINIKQ
jgi:hypothetical protein